MKQLFQVLKDENPQLILEINDCCTKFIDLINKAATYDEKIISDKFTSELIASIYEYRLKLPTEGIQLVLHGLPEEEQAKDSISLKDDFTYVRPSGFDIYRGKLVEISTFKELYIGVLEFLFQRDRELFLSLEKRSKFNGNIRPYFSKEPTRMQNPIEITNTIFAETHFNSNQIRDMLIKLFILFNIEAHYLSIYVKQDNKKKFGYHKRSI